MPPIVVIGGSTGALEAVLQIVERLPADFPAAVLLVIHTAPDNPGVLDRVLTLRGRLPAHYAVDDEPIQPSTIYLARGDWHLIVKRDRVRITQGPRENRFRPALDPLFRTAAVTKPAR